MTKSHTAATDRPDHDGLVLTAFEIGDILNRNEIAFDTWEGTINLDHAQARTLLGLARKGVEALGGTAPTPDPRTATADYLALRDNPDARRAAMGLG